MEESEIFLALSLENFNISYRYIHVAFWHNYDIWETSSNSLPCGTMEMVISVLVIMYIINHTGYHPVMS